MTDLEQFRDAARQALLARRTAAGVWEGHLSNSALSTATAVIALRAAIRAGGVVDRDAAERLVAGGQQWLSATQNEDGGWGDTTQSMSNISTTALCWGALKNGDGSHFSHAESGKNETRPYFSRAEAWLARAAGGLEPAQLVRAIEARYGKDRTFSVPILTALAIAGRLGPDGWRFVRQLPFELAACPARWFKWMRLPVVSYALPALIAIGQARHRVRPTRNPMTRAARRLAGARTLRVLRGIQPSSGGYLEATPLTSFVVMSLAAAGFPGHPVARDGIAFLTRAVRGDGSWPIDTNLATWVTTLAVDALGGLESKGPEAAASERSERATRTERGVGAPASERVGEPEGRSPSIKVIDWLLAQQYQCEHPYTHAAPGGWAWTDLPGGVPDADDTAGALVALRTLAARDPRAREAAASGVRWLLDLQNRDGGVPTFCRGWGALPFDRSGADLTAHAVRAWLAWRDDLPQMHEEIDGALERAARYLAREQRADGAWAPLWFGNEAAPGHVNLTYGTSKVVMAMARLAAHDTAGTGGMLERGAAWLIQAQREDGGWGGALDAPAATIEETAVAVAALAAAGPSAGRKAAMKRGVEWLRGATDAGRAYPAAPIGLYFASLWYSEDLYPVIFTVAALEAAAGGSA